MTANESLKSYLDSLTYSERRAKSRDIRAGLGVSVSVLSDWKRGRTIIPKVYFDKIIDILGVDLKSNLTNS